MANRRLNIFAGYYDELRRPLFQFCGTFSGVDGQSAYGWLQKFEYEHRSYLLKRYDIPPVAFIHTVEMLLVEDAASWAKTTWEIINIFEKDAPTASDVESFKILFADRFQGDPPHRSFNFNFAIELKKLRQENGETIRDYYQRAVDLLNKAGGRDVPNLASRRAGDRVPLSTSESNVLALLRKEFVTGIAERSTSKSVDRAIDAGELALRNLLAVAEGLPPGLGTSYG